MAVGCHDDRRLRKAGTDLERFLADSRSVRSTVRLLRRPRLLPQLLYQSFVIMARRIATSRPGFDPRAFTEAVLRRSGEPRNASVPTA
jgi:hypothetical protein